jgi:multicomponent Na+:H+ antiporter subunit D
VNGEALLIAAVLTPLARAAAAAAMPRPPGLRDLVNIGFALAHAAAALLLAFATSRDGSIVVTLAQPLPGVDFALAAEPLGAMIVAGTAVLAVAHAFHTAGYLRATRDAAPARLQAMIGLAGMSAAGVLLAANLFTLYVFYQALILAAFGLTSHAGDAAARAAAGRLLATLLAASAGLLLPAIVWTYGAAGDLQFRLGGFLEGRVGPISANILLALFAFGYAAAAAPPLHRWASGVASAPYPAAAAILALYVAPAGAGALLKTTLSVFGDAMQDAQIVARLLLALACATMIAAALVALSKQDIRERLAYTTVAQVAAVMAGAMVANPAGAFAGALQIVAFACAALTMWMAAGAAYVATGWTEAREMIGLGRRMPWTFAGFALGAASLIGLPPLAGAWPKLWLITAGAEPVQATGQAELIWAGALAAAASIAAFASLGPMALRALTGPSPTDPFRRPDAASIFLVGPVLIAAACTFALIAVADRLAAFLLPIWSQP